MGRTSVQRLARVLRVLVIVIFVCNVIALIFVPMAVAIYQSGGIGAFSSFEGLADYIGVDFQDTLAWAYFLLAAGLSWGRVWGTAYTAVLAVFLLACGICTAIILWQGKRVLDTVLAGEPFSMKNAANLRRAAVCCFVISGAALARLIWGIIYCVRPLLIYDVLFVPVFLVGGLLFLVMSALFRQAAELKAENDLTI